MWFDEEPAHKDYKGYDKAKIVPNAPDGPFTDAIITENTKAAIKVIQGETELAKLREMKKCGS